MSLQKPLYLFFICCFITLLWSASGCAKDYSYEGGPPLPLANDTTNGKDTVYKPLIPFPSCTSCQASNSLALSQWHFKNERTFLCGSVTGAVITPERNAFTFFGPSACSSDTGIIVTAYFANHTLNSDKKDIAPERVSFEYYDNTTNSKIISSWLPHPFSLTIQEYKHDTRIATGTFSGYAFNEQGDSTLVQSGAFKIQFQ
jgi:hypothetical protein